MYDENYNEESIYNLIPKQCSEQEKTNRHMSKYHRTAIDDLSKNKAPHRTMGPLKEAIRPPNAFLKKHEGEPKLPETDVTHDCLAPFKYQDCKTAEFRKPPVPKPNEQPLMGLRTNKDFITQNAVENIMAIPKKPEKKYVDTRRGDQHDLIPSGLDPIYINKKDFGRTPVYLTKRYEEIKRAQDEYDAYVSDHFRRGAMRQLTEEERTSILDGLKDNWEQLQKEFLTLSVVMDTVPKQMRKQSMEVKMKQLERDVEMFETHKVIYITN